MAVNWGLGVGNNALANFQYGLQIGQGAAARRDEREHRNALLDLKRQELEGEQAKRDTEARTADVRGRAAQGDVEAMAELAGLDIGAWRGLQADQRTATNDRAKVLGNAALDVLNRPPEQRSAAWDAYVDQLSQTMPEAAQYRGRYSEETARAIVAQAELIGKLHEQENPHYQAIPEGGTLVDTSNPAAVQQYMESLGNVPPPPAGFTIDVPGGSGGNAAGGFPGTVR